MKLEMPPKRAAPASTSTAPASITRPAARAMRRTGSVPPMLVVADSSTAADDEVAETMAKRLLPASA